MTEIWKSLSTYEGLYEISDHGRIRSFQRSTKGQILSIFNHYKGYLRVCVYKKDKKTTIYIHRAVAIVFIPNEDPENLIIVNHKDLNKKNNHHINLEWVTCKENIQHYYDSKNNDDF